MDPRATSDTFLPKFEKSNKSSLKKFLISFLKKVFLIFWQMELSSPKLKKPSYIFLEIFCLMLQEIFFLYYRRYNFSAPNLEHFLNFCEKRFLYLIFFIRIFLIRIFLIRIIRRCFYAISSKLRCLSFLATYLHSYKNTWR